MIKVFSILISVKRISINFFSYIEDEILIKKNHEELKILKEMNDIQIQIEAIPRKQ